MKLKNNRQKILFASLGVFVTSASLALMISCSQNEAKQSNIEAVSETPVEVVLLKKDTKWEVDASNWTTTEKQLFWQDLTRKLEGISISSSQKGKLHLILTDPTGVKRELYFATRDLSELRRKSGPKYTSLNNYLNLKKIRLDTQTLNRLVLARAFSDFNIRTLIGNSLNPVQNENSLTADLILSKSQSFIQSPNLFDQLVGSLHDQNKDGYLSRLRWYAEDFHETIKNLKSNQPSINNLQVDWDKITTLTDAELIKSIFKNMNVNYLDSAAVTLEDTEWTKLAGLSPNLGSIPENGILSYLRNVSKEYQLWQTLWATPFISKNKPSFSLAANHVLLTYELKDMISVLENKATSPKNYDQQPYLENGFAYKALHDGALELITTK